MASLYRRTKLGWLWLVLRATGPVGLNAVVFGGILQVGPDNVPYFLFMVCGMTTWVLFERSLLYVTRSLERNRRLVTKIYFPRLILPMAAVAPGLLFLAILLLVTVGTVVFFRQQDGVWYITLRPELMASVAAILMSLAFTVAVGLWTSVLQARYRDIRFGLRYVMQVWFYLTPIIYPLSDVEEKWRWLMMFNPMAAVVALFKWGTLGLEGPTVTGIVSSVSLIAVAAISGMWFFNREEAASIDRM
jgi:lipopolysaccharide transport system permease protein